MKICCPGTIWEIEIAGMAYNGLEAFDLISRISPDIVITDIKMPGLDGLELIQKCKGIDENISFILVSGHRDFEYAQNAIKHGADDYLLKPVTREDITHVIEKIIGKKRELLRTKAESLKIQDELNRNRAVLRKQLADNLLADECRGIARGGLTPEEINSRYAVNFGGGSYLVFILKLDYVRYHLANQKFISHMIGKVEPILEKNLLPLCRDLVFAPTRSAVYGFLNLKGEEHSFKQNLTVLFDEILGVIKEYHDYPVTLAVGCTVKNLNDLSLSFDRGPGCSQMPNSR